MVLQVKVVILDSISFHFRQDFDDMALRTRVLGGMALKLMKLARKFGVAVRILSPHAFSVYVGPLRLI